MKTVKIVLISLGLLVLVMVVVSFFLPRKVQVEESIEIEGTAEQVYDQVNNLKNWVKWAPWVKMDPNMTIEFEGPESGEGAGYSWKSEEMGNGRLTIASSVPFESVSTVLEFMESGTPSYADYRIQETESGIQVTWTMDSDMGYNPVSKWFGVFMKGMLRDDFKKGLVDLKKLVEALPEPDMISIIKIEEIPSFRAVTITDTSDQANFVSRLGQLVPQIYMTLEMQGIEATGPVFTVYHQWSEDIVILQTGVPVGDQTPSLNAPMEMVEFPVQLAASAVHTGSMDTEETHYTIMDWVEEQGYVFSGPPVEVSLSENQSDSTKWKTKIYYPVQR